MEDSGADPSQFYTGVIAQLYEPLAAGLAPVEPIARFVRKTGGPALELACGAGHPMLDLIAEGLDVDGIDSSQDMLDLAAAKASARGLPLTTYCQPMQALDLPRRYRCCYLAGASFCLLTELEDVRAALDGVFRHLEPGGLFSVPLFQPETTPPPYPRRSTTRSDGAEISVQTLRLEEDPARQLHSNLLRYEIRRNGELESREDRAWRLRWHTAEQFEGLLQTAGFERVRQRTYGGDDVEPLETNFVALARRPA